MAKAKQGFSVSSFIASKIDDVKYAQSKVTAVRNAKADLTQACKIANDLVTAIKPLADNIRADAWISVSSYDNTVEMYVTIEIPKRLAILDPATKRATYLAALAGFELDEGKKNASEYYASYVVKGKLTIGAAQIVLDIRSELDMESEAATCKRIQVGTEIREVAKYEIVCS